MGYVNNWWKKKYNYKLGNMENYFPETLYMSLIECSKKCGKADIAPAIFEHICMKCRKKMKAEYLLKYKLKRKRLFRRKNYCENFPIQKGNQDEKINWIDDITKEDLIAGTVDCIGDIKEVPIALATCTKKCKHWQLVLDGGPQVCPICGEEMFRMKVKWYVLCEEQD